MPAQAILRPQRIKSLQMHVEEVFGATPFPRFTRCKKMLVSAKAVEGRLVTSFKLVLAKLSLRTRYFALLAAMVVLALEAGHSHWAWLAASAVLFLPLLGLLWFEQAVIAPVGQLKQALAHFLQQDLSARATTDRFDEIGRASLALNELAEGLQSRHVQTSTKLQELQDALAAAEESAQTKSGILSLIADEIRVGLAEARSANPAAVLQQVLDYIELEAGPVQPRHSLFSLVDFLQESVAEARRQASGRRLDISATTASGAIQIHTDRPRLLRAVRLLVDQAVEFSPSGAVHVEANAFGPNLALTVSYSASQGETSEESFRLAVCQRLVQCLRGQLRVESHPVGGGAFTITLPCVFPSLALAA